LVLALTALTAAPAQAAFPYGDHTAGQLDYHLPTGPNHGPNDLTGNVEWMYSATADPANLTNNARSYELGGVRGAHIVDNADVPTAWQATTGRPDVNISVLDSGIEWDNHDAMVDLRKKMRLNKGELPEPNAGRSTALEAGVDCSTYTGSGYDLNGDGVFNVIDYACDTRVERDPAVRTSQGKPAGQGPADLLDPQDVLIAFSNGDDADHNGFKDDIVGWDFLDDDNDPYDDVQYGHGTGEARDSSSEADNGGSLGACPNCMVVPLRVGTSFVADVNHFAEAAIYATDNDIDVIQEALGTLNNSPLAHEAVDYAYDHGVTVIASAADEAAQHNNWPSSLPHVIVVNSVTQFDSTFTPEPSSYLQFNGCTNFNSKITVAIPSVSCSSDATGRASGMAGLIISAARNAGYDATPNEVRQLMASGEVDGTEQADDVDFAKNPATGTETELTCPTPGCTDPFLGAPPQRPVVSPLITTQSYPARFGHDQFYGYGRVNMRNAVVAAAGQPPPEVEITSPQWYEMVDPHRTSVDVRGQIYARGDSYTCRVYVAPGAYPNDHLPGGDFQPVASGPCDGSAAHSGRLDGVIGTIDVAALKARFPPETTGTNFTGPEPGGLPAQLHSGRPNDAPYGFVIRVEATTTGAHPRVGRDRRQLYLHRDQDMLDGFPRQLPGDGDSSPLLADLDGDNRNELILAGSDGFVHAYRRDGSELPGWPVRGDKPPFHTGGHAFASGEVSSNYGGAIVGSPAVGDLDGDGVPEVVAADMEGKVYVWSAGGKRLHTMHANPDYSGHALSPFVPERHGNQDRVEHGFLASPVIADLDPGKDGGRKEIVAAGTDRHVYAWNDDGSDVGGFPVLVVDHSKVQSIDSTSDAVTFDPAKVPEPLNQGAIVDTPAVANLVGDGDSAPEILVGTNEEYRAGAGTEPALNASPLSAAAANLLSQTGQLSLANGRLYAIHPDGNDHAGGAFVDHWPAKVGILEAELLPLVGEGINGSPVVAKLRCGGSDPAPAVGVIPAAGLGYVFKADGTSCFGQDSGVDRALASDAGGQGVDATKLTAVGLPAFGQVGSGEPALIAPVAGVIRALDAAVNEYQGGADGLGLWETDANGQFRPGWPTQMNDLQFLTGPAVGDLDGSSGEEVLEGSASMDLQAFTAAGTRLNARWPKLTADWMVSTPTIGSFGSLDTDSSARKAVLAVTRRGTILAYRTDAPACSPSSSPRFHHDNDNSGDFDRDAIAPGKPTGLQLSGRALSFTAPGDDLLCGKAAKYEVSGGLGAPPAPAEAGTRQSVSLAASAGPILRIRAVDEQGNRGRVAILDLRRAAPGGGSGGSGASKGCLNSRGGAGGKRLGPAVLGRQKATQRRHFRGKRLHSRGGIDRYCVSGGGSFRIGYTSGRLSRHLSRRTRRRVRGRTILILTSSKRYSVKRIKAGTSVRTLRRRLHGERRFRVGGNTWYLAAGSRARLLFKTRRGRVLEVGIGDKGLTRTRTASRRYLRAWQQG
jgi:hypothetical protein